ncbi:hypothetical protein [Chitinibacter sp. S2-10]|uniref:hypothetical protein n=1 Tax=Chitinibacter sp. S2-10 TaxID=3373597 RepID=UPI003977AE7D
MKIKPGISAAVLSLSVLVAQAAPAPWHLWASKLDGKLVCAQTSPGEGWRLFKGPFKDANCTPPSPTPSQRVK